ncbi:hypothetical protein PCASD_24538, partial [Puccinia coronata f. sp. avenae]
MPHFTAVLLGGDVVAPVERLVPARRRITPRRAGTSLYQPTEELFLGDLYQLTKELFFGKPVQALTCSARNNSSPRRYKLEPARQGAIPWRAGASRYLLAEENASANWYKLVPARRRQRRRPP